MSFEEEVLNAYSFLNFGYDGFLGGQMQQAFRRRVSAKIETPQDRDRPCGFLIAELPTQQLKLSSTQRKQIPTQVTE